jgi:hypothetical protein
VNIEYDGKNYDVLELPVDGFLHLVHGLSKEQYDRIDETFAAFWPDPTVRRHHLLSFVADQLGTSLDFLLLNRETVRFHMDDLQAYIEEHTKQGNRPS